LGYIQERAFVTRQGLVGLETLGEQLGLFVVCRSFSVDNVVDFALETSFQNKHCPQLWQCSSITKWPKSLN